jgi:hypothetical protein
VRATQILVQKGERLGLLVATSVPDGLAVREEKTIRNHEKVRFRTILRDT